MSVIFNMLGIEIESYGHVIGPPRVSSDSEKNNFSRKLKLFFNSLIGKFGNVIKVWLGIGFCHGGVHFLAQSTYLTQKTHFS